jgi:ABC-2 type transport system permease protein
MREWKRILYDSRIASLMLVGPFLYVLLFGAAYWNGSVRHVPIVILDQDHSRLSREITTALGASESLSIYSVINSPQDFLPLVRREKAYACVVFPANLERDVLAGGKAKVEVIEDGSNLVIGNVSSRAIDSVLTTFRVEIGAKDPAFGGVPVHALKSTSMPIQPVLRAPFNPAFNYSFYILMGAICVVVQQVTRMGSSISLLLDDADELWSGLEEPAPSVLSVFLAKVTATAVLVIPGALVAMSLIFVFFRAPLRGSALLLFFIFAAYLFLQISIGYGYGVLFRFPVIVTQFHLFMSVILFVLSGFSWPYYSMPHWLRPIVFCTPAFHMNSILRKIALDGAGPGLLLNHMAALLIMMAIAIPWAYWAVLRQLARTGRMETSNAQRPASGYFGRL